MTQDDILKIIKNYPGIETSELRKLADISRACVAKQVAALVLKKHVIRGQGKNRNTDKLFPA